MKSLSLSFVLSLIALAVAQDTTATDGLNFCLTGSSVQTSFAGSPGFADASAAYNLRLHPHPIGVAFPKNAQEVSEVVSCAAKSGVPIVTRSGGHSYAGFGLGGEAEPGALTVDLGAFTSFSYDDKTQTATFGPGNRLGDLALALFDKGRALPHGTCPTVGSGGHASFGGYGFYSRKWGLTLDRVVGHEVVLANGSIVKTSKTENPELFWGLRGSAPSFGVITSYTVTTEPVPQQNVQVLISWDLPAQPIISTFLKWQAFLPTAPLELGMAFRMYKGKTNSTLRLDFLGQYMGTVAQFNATLLPIINTLPAAETYTVAPIDWIPMLEWLAGTPLKTSTGPKVTDTFYAKSLAVREDQHMTEAQITSFINYLSTTQDTPLNWFAMADTWGGKGSAINSVGADDTAFGSRKNEYGWQLYGWTVDSKPPFPDSGVQFVQGMWDAIVKSAPSGWDFGGYSNYVDAQLTDAQWQKFYYGQHYPRLQSLKRAVDPRNVFRFPQSIKAH